jgi:hypothetical protein
MLPRSASWPGRVRPPSGTNQPPGAAHPATLSVPALPSPRVPPTGSLCVDLANGPRSLTRQGSQTAGSPCGVASRCTSGCPGKYPLWRTPSVRAVPTTGSTALAGRPGVYGLRFGGLQQPRPRRTLSQKNGRLVVVMNPVVRLPVAACRDLNALATRTLAGQAFIGWRFRPDLRADGDLGGVCPETHHVADRLLPLKQMARHPLDPPSTLPMRRPAERWFGGYRPAKT